MRESFVVVGGNGHHQTKCREKHSPLLCIMIWNMLIYRVEL